MTRITLFPLLLISLTILPLLTEARQINISFETGVASFNQRSLISLQNEIMENNSQLGLAITDQFPSRPFYRVAILSHLKDDLLVGTFMAFTSTGGRLTVSDYSGRLDIDQVVSNLQLGLTLQNKFNIDGLLSPFIQFYASSDFTKFHLTEQFQIGSSKNKNDSEFRSLNFSIEPAAGIIFQSLPLKPIFSAGYVLHIHPFPLHLSDNKDAKLQIGGGNAFNDFSGFRAGISLSITTGS